MKERTAGCLNSAVPSSEKFWNNIKQFNHSYCQAKPQFQFQLGQDGLFSQFSLTQPTNPPTPRKVRKWSNIARLIKAKLINSTKQLYIIKMMNLCP